MQFFDHVTTDDGRTIDFDILPIYKGNKKKDIYFDITDFYSGAHVEFTEVRISMQNKRFEIFIVTNHKS